MSLVRFGPFVGWQSRELVGEERLEEWGAVKVELNVADDLGGGEGLRFCYCYEARNTGREC